MDSIADDSVSPGECSKRQSESFVTEGWRTSVGRVWKDVGSSVTDYFGRGGVGSGCYVVLVLE